MLVDCRCPKCETIYEDKILFSNETYKCEKCDVDCEVIPALNATFRLKYTNSKDICSWAAEGYSTSQYHSAQKKLCKNNIFTMPKEGGSSAK